MDCFILGILSGAVGTGFMMVRFWVPEVVNKEISKIVDMHVGRAVRTAGLDREVNVLRRKLKSKREANRKLKLTLETWMEGVEKGCDAEAIEEQIRWKREQGE